LNQRTRVAAHDVRRTGNPEPARRELPERARGIFNFGFLATHLMSRFGFDRLTASAIR
jgi:hypothetical protein